MRVLGARPSADQGQESRAAAYTGSRWFLERDRDRALFNPVSPRLLFLDHRRVDCVSHTVQFSLAVGFDKCVFCAKQRIGVYVHSVQFKQLCGRLYFGCAMMVWRM